MRKRLVLAAGLLLIAATSFAQGLTTVYREPLKWQSSQAGKVGVLVVTDALMLTGASVADTSAPVSLKCLHPHSQYAPVATDSLLWCRVVIEPTHTANSAGNFGEGGASPTITLYGMPGPNVGPVLLNKAGSAMTKNLSIAYGAGSADSSYSFTMSWGTAATASGVGGAASNFPYLRVVIPAHVMAGGYRGWIEYLTSCPELVNGAKP